MQKEGGSSIKVYWFLSPHLTTLFQLGLLKCKMND
jgi:hypothetical protein